MKPRRPIAQGRSDTAAPPQLVSLAELAADNAYAPYSGLRVGAAVETIDGKHFSAANMENASYGLTLCAEAGALQAASSAGVLSKIRRIVIAGGPVQSRGHQLPATAPCGRCRQLIAEAAQVAGYDIEVWYGSLGASTFERRTISELLPDAFGPHHLAPAADPGA